MDKKSPWLKLKIDLAKNSQQLVNTPLFPIVSDRFDVINGI